MLSDISLNFSVVSWQFWFAIFIVTLVLFFYLRKILRTESFIRYMCVPNFQSFLVFGYSKVRRLAKNFLFLLAVIFIFFTFLQLYYGEKKIKLPQAGRTVLFALDISRSMLATDISHGHLSRLDFAKSKIRSLIEILGPERVGLMLFADTAFLQCPFTKDPKNFLSFLDQVDSTVVSSAAVTSIVEPLKKSIEFFSKVQVGSKILIMFSDGEDFSKAETAALNQAKKENIALFALGVGSEAGAPVPILDNLGLKVIGHEKDLSGNIVLTKLDKAKLKAIVDHLGGEYLSATMNDYDLQKIKDFIKKFESAQFEDAEFTLRNELYPWFAMLAAGCLLIESLL